jgi:hypothetical protein
MIRGIELPNVLQKIPMFRRWPRLLLFRQSFERLLFFRDPIAEWSVGGRRFMALSPSLLDWNSSATGVLATEACQTIVRDGLLTA